MDDPVHGPEERLDRKIAELEVKVLMLSVENAAEPLSVWRQEQLAACKRLLVKYRNFRDHGLTHVPLLGLL